MIRINPTKVDNNIYISTHNTFFEKPFTFKVFDDRVEFQQRTQFYSGKIKKASKYVNKNAPIRYEQHLKDFEFPIGKYEPEIIEDKLIIYKES